MSLLSKVITGTLNFELLTNICCAIDSIDLIYLANKNRHIKIVRVDEAFFQSVVSVLKLHLYKSLFVSVSLGQVWLTALRSKGKGKEILVSFKANQTAVTFF